MSSDSNDPWDRLFEPKTSPGTSGFRYTEAPSVLPEIEQAPQQSPPMLLAAMLVAVWLVSIVQGTLAWIVLEYIEDIGWLDERVPWWPCVAIIAALNMIRFFDRVAFRRT